MNFMKICTLTLAVGMFLAGGSLYIRVRALEEENAGRRRQLRDMDKLLSHAQEARQGRLMKIADLPQGSYIRLDDPRLVFVQLETEWSTNPQDTAFAVCCDKGNVPERFNSNNVDKKLNGFREK